MRRVVLAPDKWKGTATAAEVAEAMAEGARRRGWDPVPVPLSDGGEGLLDACAGRCPELVPAVVVGPLGTPVEASWRLGGSVAVVELAAASGLTLAGGPEGNDPVAATTYGTGQLVAEAARAVGPGGTVVVGLGGSATTDGGAGLVAAVEEGGGLAGTSLVAACDVTTAFLDAAAVFGPQKGADSGQVEALAERLAHQAAAYRDRFGVDVRPVPGAGAAGGAGGGVLALGGRLTSGYGLVSDLVGLAGLLAGADRAVTAEGGLDGTSFDGKVVGGVVADARVAGVPVLVVAGSVTAEGRTLAEGAGADVVAVAEQFGVAASRREPAALAARAVQEWLGAAR